MKTNKYLFFILAFCYISASYGQNLPLPQLVQRIENSVFTVFATDQNGNVFSQGSGFFINSNGVSITNFHVLEGAQGGFVEKKNGERLEITRIIDYDVNSDLVKFQIDSRGRQFTALPLSMTIPQRGEDIVNLSTPLGLEQTLSTGIVSSVRECGLFGTVIQITAPISSGSSGSPILNRDGEVLGVATFGVEGGQNLNFAVSTLNFHRIGGSQNIALRDIGRDPLETPNIRQARQAFLIGDYETVFHFAMAEYQENPENHIALFLLGRVLYVMEDFANTIEALTRAIHLAPQIAQNYSVLAITLGRLGSIEYHNRNFANAQEYFSYALQVYEMALSLENHYLCHTNKAILLWRLVMNYETLNIDRFALDIATEHLNTAIRLNPYNELAFIVRSSIRRDLGNYWGAISDIERAIVINPFNSLSFRTRGIIKGLFLNDHRAGIKDLNIALSLAERDDDRADILVTKGFQSFSWFFSIVTANDIERNVDLLSTLLTDMQRFYREAYIISGDRKHLESLESLLETARSVLR